MSYTYDPEFTQAAHNYVPQSTIQYITFIKRAAVESLQDAFAVHASQTVKNTKVGVSFSQGSYKLPAVLVQYYERSIYNAGVGHEEWLPAPSDPNPSNPTQFIKYYHRLYKGQLAFDIYGQSTMDLSILRDAVVEILAMTDASPWGNQFIQRMYFYLNQTPYGLWNFPVLNTDIVTGFGESQSQLPWAPEDKLAYKSTYRIDVFGNLYSATPTTYTTSTQIASVDLDVSLVDDANAPTTTFEEDFYSFSGWPSGSESFGS